MQVNLDDMGALLDGLDSDAERGQWLAGFRVGSRGLEAGEGPSVRSSFRVRVPRRNSMIHTKTFNLFV